MKDITTMKINASAEKIYKAITDGKQITNFWFSSSSNKWGIDKKIVLRYDEYNYEGTIYIIELIEFKLIKFQSDNERIVTIQIFEEENYSVVKVTEEEFLESANNFVESIMENKEGWIFMLCCLKEYLEHNINDLRSSLM